MATVSAFRGVRYNPARVAELSEVVCPPYDVISPADQHRYHDRHPLNVVRLEQGQVGAGDTPEDNKYTRSAALYRSWLEEGALVREVVPALYVYDQEFSWRGQALRRRSLVAGVRLEEWARGVVLPHEHTLAKPKADRLSLMRACAANFSPLMALYEDPGEACRSLLDQATGGDPDVALVDETGEGHRLWVVTDPDVIAGLTERIGSGPIYMADGHHRYETSLCYRDEMRAQQPGYTGAEPYNFVMMALISVSDPGLVVLPTHRLVAGPARLAQADLLSRLESHFVCTRLEPTGGDPAVQVQRILEEGRVHDAPTFALYSSEEDAFYRLEVRDLGALRAGMPVEKSASWKQLDVSLLHAAVIEGVLALNGGKNGLSYTRDEVHAVGSVRAGESWLALFVRPTSVHQVREVALARDCMPQKSTYFYPKLATGLVIYQLT